MRPRPEVRGTALGLLALLGLVTVLVWQTMLIVAAGTAVPLIWLGSPYALAAGLGCAQLLILMWGREGALRRGLNRRLPEGPPRSW